MTADDPETSPAGQQQRTEREEDSGLHDIRNLAQSTKQRLSSRRITAQPVPDDVLASSSGSFKNIALPQPAKMVSLPALDELPSKAEIAAAEKAAKKAAKAAKEAQEAKAEASASAVAATPAVAEPQPAVETPAAKRQAFALPSQQQKSKAPLFAVVGIGLAAAAGAVIYVQTSKSSDRAAAPVAAEQAVANAEPAPAAPAPTPTITATEIPVEPPPAEPAAAAPQDPAAAGAAQLAADDAKDEAEKNGTDAKGRAKKQKVEKDEPTTVEQKKAPDKTDKADKNAKPQAKGSDDEEPSFDALLKEAGVTEKKETKPKLAKKSLTGADFKAAMEAVEGKAKACYKGTVGTVMVHMTIEPDGSIKKLTVGGAFAGKPEAACVQAAMKTATFPPWDGAPQSFSYAVMLSD